jgi:biopolymer transport protein ExbD
VSLNLIVRFHMRVLLVPIGLLMLRNFAWATEAPGVNCPSSIHISAGNACRIDEVEVPCDSLGARLKAIPVASTCYVHITVDKSSTYEVVRSALESIREAGYVKIGFVNAADP